MKERCTGVKSRSKSIVKDINIIYLNNKIFTALFITTKMTDDMNFCCMQTKTSFNEIRSDN